MSMLCSLYRITPEQSESLKDFPEAVGELLGFTTLTPKVSLLSKLFGKPQKQPPPKVRKFQPIVESDIFELNQAWHILHFLFSGSNAESEWPAGFILSGGEDIGPDQGYGPTRMLNPERNYSPDPLVARPARAI